jgi:hypothetical protein
MGLGSGFVDAHIARWEEQLRSPWGSYRDKWPSRLFHHAPIENAVKIIQEGRLLSRNDSQGKRPRDVAGQGVIDASQRAHRYVRLYFRPRTPTQFHIEGIRRAAECQFASHAPVLVMFVFDARRVLALNGVHFSEINMQTGVVEQNDEASFAAIPFDKVYHDSAHSDPNITRHRCAEVLAPSPMPLDGVLQWIYCRSEAEKEYLLYLIANCGDGWRPRIVVSDDLKVFQRKFTFVEHVSLVQNGVLAKLAPRFDGTDVTVRVQVRDLSTNRTVLDWANQALAPRPWPSEFWRFPVNLYDGYFHVKIDLENELAYEDVLPFGQAPF